MELGQWGRPLESAMAVWKERKKDGDSWNVTPFIRLLRTVIQILNKLSFYVNGLNLVREAE
ncbi:unnamed protein product [Malus baccata var. baccata]